MQEAINGLAEADRPQVICSASAVGNRLFSYHHLTIIPVTARKPELVEAFPQLGAYHRNHLQPGWASLYHTSKTKTAAIEAKPGHRLEPTPTHVLRAEEALRLVLSARHAAHWHSSGIAVRLLACPYNPKIHGSCVLALSRCTAVHPCMLPEP